MLGIGFANQFAKAAVDQLQAALPRLRKDANVDLRLRALATSQRYALGKTFAAGDAAGVFRTVDKVIEVGQDPRRFAEDLLRRLRDLIILAARPGMGKSTLGLDLARAASIKHKLTSCFFSLEMGKSEIVQRLISAEAGVPLNHIRKGQMGDDDWQRIARKTGEVSSAPLFIDDSPNLTMMEIRSKARRLKQRNDLKLVIIDYMQLMSSGKKVESRQLEVSEFSRQIKLLAKELEVPVVALSQLNRGPEQRTDKRPMVSDLRESGSLEQDADVVLLIHRDEMYNQDSEKAGMAEVIIGKQRSGPTGVVELAFQGHFARFAEIAQ